MQYDKMKLSVGIFVIVLFLSIAVFTYILLDAKGAFSKRYSYYFITDSAASFSIGMPVKFSGFAIGTIDAIDLQDDGNVKIYFSVTQDNRRWINRYTNLLLKKPLIGAPHIEVLATSGHGTLPQNSRLPIIITDDINDMISKLEPAVNNLLAIIKNLKTLSNSLIQPDAALQQTLLHLEEFTHKLAQNDALLTSITGDNNATQALNRSLVALEHTMEEIKRLTTQVDAALMQPASHSLKTFHNILRDVLGKLEDLDPLVQASAADASKIKALKANLLYMIEKSNELLDTLDRYLQKEPPSKVPLP